MILLTGASGFIGKHLQRLLINKYGKEKIVCFTSKPIKDCDYLLHNNFNFERDFFVNQGYSKIHTLIHAGAFTPKSGIEANDILLSNSNINNTFNLINANLPSLKKLVFLSTLDIYQTEENISENTPEKPISLYGYSKLYSEKMIENWGNQNNIATQILRVGHVYGPGEEAYQKIIPVTIKNIIEGKSIEIWGTGQELRSFIYIKDVVTAIVNAIDLPNPVGVINLVGSKPISVIELVHLICKIASVNTNIQKKVVTKESRNLIFDASKMKKYLLEIETTLEEGLIEEFNYMKQLNIYNNH